MSSLKQIAAWFDSTAVRTEKSDHISWTRVVPFIMMHLAVVGVFWVGFSWFAFWVCIFLYFVRMFAITGFYHRYFSHKNFKTSRFLQFVFAFVGATSAQRGPLWWASHHRFHHAKSDTSEDPHSPRQKGFMWSHALWFLSDKNFATNERRIKDFTKFPELKWLDRFDVVAPAILAVVLFGVGEYLTAYYPGLETSGWQLVIWGFFISTILLYHATYTINSLAHRFGSRRFETKDDSRNNLMLALLTMGEGWHNNHHYYSGTARQGFVWYEIDLTFYILKLMSYCGLVWDLKPIPDKIKTQLHKA
ncbi:MAG: fatty acid desaturase [Kangiellaceae bacterium]|nr:fatty acid desaturase [Kangiellaceae bacterium]MCW8999208.1 fatty acid desaturase [Kangiellaceae bacterium]MCW9016764.1 fatty acid desaturase [Kangiellaceae bacterium]